MEDAPMLGIERVRLTCDPFWLNLQLARGRIGYRLLHAAVFRWLSGRARPRLRAKGIKHTRTVFGLLQDGRVNEAYVCRLLPRLPPGDSELYSHPAVHEGGGELAALTSSRVRQVVDELGIRLIRYQDL